MAKNVRNTSNRSLPGHVSIEEIVQMPFAPADILLSSYRMPATP